MAKYQPPPSLIRREMTCKICEGKQQIPFVKNGKTISYAFVDCECKVEKHDHFQQIRPEDFDYSMSDTYRDFTFELYGRPWERSGSLYEPEEAPATEPIEIDPYDAQEIAHLNRRHQYQIDQVRNELINVRQQIQQITGRKLEPGKTSHQSKKSTYKGLVMNKEAK